MERAHANIERPLGEPDLSAAVIEIQKLKRCSGIEPKRGGADMQFSARPFINPKMVARG